MLCHGNSFYDMNIYSRAGAGASKDGVTPKFRSGLKRLKRVEKLFKGKRCRLTAQDGQGRAIIVRQSLNVSSCLPSMNTEEAIPSFWNWFRSNRLILRDVGPDEPLWDRALEQLHLVDERLSFEMSRPTDAFPVRELIVTAQGEADAFEVAEALVAAAPELPGWQVIPLKPAMGFDFKTDYEGASYDPSEMWFLPLESSRLPWSLGLKIGVPGLEPERNANALGAVLIILDTALGERTTALEIDHVEVSPLPSNPESHGYIELTELPDYLTWRRRKMS